jgi:hypothetical protein
MTTLRLATDTDDPVLRELMRGNGMATWVEMAIEREPSFFAGKQFCDDEWAVIAEENQEVVGMYTAAMRPVYVNGRPERLGYLGGLRVARNHRHRIRHLRKGYASIRPLAPATGTLPWWFTVVAADNLAARRLLESGVRGLPTYHLLGEYVTLGLPASRGRRQELWRRADETEVDDVVAFHNAHAARVELGPVLDDALARRVGLDHFYVLERDGVVQGVAALWDQRSFKQIVALRYRRPIGRLLPVYNAYARLFQRIPLPREGGALNHTFIAFLALADDDVRSDIRRVLRDLLSHCRTPVASLGLHTAHPLLETLMDFKPVRYPARVYGVTFEGRPPVSEHPVQPEAAFL